MLLITWYIGKMWSGYASQMLERVKCGEILWRLKTLPDWLRLATCLVGRLLWLGLRLVPVFKSLVVSINLS